MKELFVDKKSFPQMYKGYLLFVGILFYKMVKSPKF